MSKRAFTPYILVLIFILAFYWRFHGILNNYPFWVDEYSTSAQALAILKYGFSVFTRQDVLFEQNNIATHALVAIFFKLFGVSEFSARLPFVILGSLVPVALYVFTKKLTDTRTAIAASLLATCSYFQITWSRQARGYMLVQLIVLMTLYLYFRILDSKKKYTFDFVLLIALLILGILTHFFIYLLIAAMAVHTLAINRKWAISMLRKKSTYAVALISVVIIYGTGFLTGAYDTVITGFIGSNNNLWYYHSFLWREYTLITFLGVIGLTALCVKKPKKGFAVLIYFLLHLLFIGLLFAHYISKYTLPIFPLLIMGVANSLTILTDSVLKNKPSFIRFTSPILLALLIILNGDKFVLKPRIYYSVNHDFREIANIDYHLIYRIIKEKGRIEEGKTAVVDSWIDRTKWYLGSDPQMPFYMIKWNDSKELTKRVETRIDEHGDKVLIGRGTSRIINTIADMKKVQKTYHRGFILLDDTTLPIEIQAYVIKNFKKELYLDHYPLDDNPYSVWPATLYSWGIK